MKAKKNTIMKYIYMIIHYTKLNHQLRIHLMMIIYTIIKVMKIQIIDY